MSTLEECVADVGDDLAHTVTRLSTDLQKQIAQHGAVVSARLTGGPVGRFEGDYRVVVEVYAATYSKVWQVADELTRRYLRPGHRMGEFLVDNPVCEGAFAERPYTEGTRVLVSTWLFSVRHATRQPA